MTHKIFTQRVELHGRVPHGHHLPGLLGILFGRSRTGVPPVGVHAGPVLTRASQKSWTSAPQRLTLQVPKCDVHPREGRRRQRADARRSLALAHDGH